MANRRMFSKEIVDSDYFNDFFTTRKQRFHDGMKEVCK